MMIVTLMKYTALGLVLIASALAEPGDKIPNHPNCHDPHDGNPVYFVHPTNCSRFYECNGREAWEYECPAGLHFNIKINVCDYPANAQCDPQGTVTPTIPGITTTEGLPLTTTTTTQATSTTTTESPAPASTTTTTQATSTTTTESPAPASTTTTTQAATTPNPDRTTTPYPDTTYPTTANPDITTTPYPDTTYPTTTPGSQMTTTSNPNCPPLGSPQPNYYPHSSDCSKYMGCQENCVQHFQCPEGLYWNNVQKRCDVFANSQCPCPIIPPAPNVWTSNCYNGYC